MEANKKLSPNVTELVLRGRQFNISLLFISQSYLKVPKTISLNATYYFIMKILIKDKIQYSLDRKSTEILTLSSGKVSKYEFLNGKVVLPEKDFLEKAATIKRFDHSPLGSEMKKQTDSAKKEYQGLGKIHRFDKEDDELMRKKELKKYKKFDLVYNNKFSFYSIIRYDILKYSEALYNERLEIYFNQYINLLFPKMI